MKRFLLTALLSCVFLPSVFAQPNDLIKYDKEVIKTYFFDKIKKEKSLNLDETQLELLGYKLDGYFADLAKKQAFGLTQQQISDLQDSTKTLANLRKDMNKVNKSLSAMQGEIDRLNTEVTNLKTQRDGLQDAVKQLKEYKDAVGQMDVLKNQIQANESKYQADLKQAAQEHTQEVSALKDQLNITRKELSDQKQNSKDLQLEIDGLNQALKDKNDELAKWQGGVESVLTAIESQCSSAKELSLAKLDPSAFQSSVNSFDGMRRFVQEIDPERVSSIDRQIEDVGKLMKVGEVFREAVGYIQGHQDATKAQAQINQLNKVRNFTKLSADQVVEMDALLTALRNQESLYRDFREYLTRLRAQECLPRKEKIEEQLKLIGQLENMDGFMLSPEYHKTYVNAINKLKDNLQKAAANDRRIAPVVKDDAKFPGMIDEILNML